MLMQIPMIFFTVIIEWRKKTPEDEVAAYRQAQAIAQWEERRWQESMAYPEYCTRV